MAGSLRRGGRLIEGEFSGSHGAEIGGDRVSTLRHVDLGCNPRGDVLTRFQAESREDSMFESHSNALSG